jgi:RNA polymerase sigma factor (sigma-70 family)
MKRSAARPLDTVVPFDRVVEEHGALVLRVCRAVVGTADAEDVWSETFLAALRQYDGLRPDSNVRGWLATIARNKGIDHLRRQARVEVRGALDTATIDRSDDDAAADALHAAITTLAPKQHDAVVYRYLADLPYEEVARLMDISPAAARRNAADGIARLRERLEGT